MRRFHTAILMRNTLTCLLLGSSCLVLAAAPKPVSRAILAKQFPAMPKLNEAQTIQLMELDKALAGHMQYVTQNQMNLRLQALSQSFDEGKVSELKGDAIAELDKSAADFVQKARAFYNSLSPDQ